MRIGYTILGNEREFNRLRCLGLHSMAWVRFAESPAGPDHEDWKPFADELTALARERDIRISAISGYYRNPLDPEQTEVAERTLRRAVEVASYMNVKTVSAFSGGVLELEENERGGFPVNRPIKDSLHQVLEFWEPLAGFAADQGVKIAFENCPQRPNRLPVQTYNLMSSTANWERLFDATRCDNLGLEWDPSHLICQLIDPVGTIQKFGSRIFHVHAKDAEINRELLAQYGIAHVGVTRHRFPGLGECNWGEIVRALIEVGYDSDLNIEGMHDPVYRDEREDEGVLIARRELEKHDRGNASKQIL